MNDERRLTRLEEARVNIEKRLDLAESNHAELRKDLRDFAEKNNKCHQSIKAIVNEAHSTLVVIDTKLGGLTRVFWIVIGAIILSSVGVIFAVALKFGGQS